MQHWNLQDSFADQDIVLEIFSHRVKLVTGVSLHSEISLFVSLILYVTGLVFVM